MSTIHRTVPCIFNEIDGKLSTLFIKTKSILSNGAPNWINGVNTENGNGSVYHDGTTGDQYLCSVSPIQWSIAVQQIKTSCGKKTEFRAATNVVSVLSETHFILFRNLRAQLFVLIFVVVSAVVVNNNFFCGDFCNSRSNVPTAYTSHSTINTQQKFRFFIWQPLSSGSISFSRSGSPSPAVGVAMRVQTLHCIFVWHFGLHRKPNNKLIWWVLGAKLSENIFVPPTVVLRFSLLSREAARALVSQFSKLFFRRTIYVSTCV